MPTHDLAYDHEGEPYRSTCTWSGGDDPRPLLLMVPNFLGPTADNLAVASAIVGERYVVCLADVYGAAVRPTDRDGARAVMAGFKDADGKARLRARTRAALDAAIAAPTVVPIDRARVACIGFCFGGGAVLELARDGVELPVVSFHGTLTTPTPAGPGAIRAPLLVCHGSADSVVPQEQVAAFVDEMHAAEVTDWQLVQYGGVGHGFSSQRAAPGERPQVGDRAFAAMDAFLDERFAAA